MEGSIYLVFALHQPKNVVAYPYSIPAVIRNSTCLSTIRYNVIALYYSLVSSIVSITTSTTTGHLSGMVCLLRRGLGSSIFTPWSLTPESVITTE